jgi:hypothetical protein
MQRCLVLYTSRYGHTDMAAKSLALVLGPARSCTPETFQDEYRSFDWFIIGGPVYAETLDPTLLEFVGRHVAWLREKRIAIFCTCLMTAHGDEYLEPLRALLGEAVVWARPVGGSIAINRLLEEDLVALETFCDQVGLPLQDMTRFDAELLMRQALEIKALRDAGGDRLPADALKARLEAFLEAHNTCTLSTGFGERVRGTPIEYLYADGSLYMFSEGGEKFANILLNRRVSVSVYDAYAGMDKLAGVQMSGDASVVSWGSSEYRQVAELKRLDYQRLAALPMALNLLRVRLRRAEFVWSPFAALGADVRQIYDFQ